MASQMQTDRPAAPMATARRRSRFFAKLLLLGLSVLAGLLAVEAAVRLAGLDHPLVYEPDPELGWRHIPGAYNHFTDEGGGIVQINSLGNRDRERPAEKAAGIFRIAVLGDSMTEGNQVNLDETFTHRLEERLNSQAHPAEVWNFGVAGYGPVQELLQLKSAVALHRPDLVIVAVFLDNDLADCHPQLTSHTNGPVFMRLDQQQPRFDHTLAAASHADYRRQPMYALRRNLATYRLASHIRNQRHDRAAASTPSDVVPRRYGLYMQSPAPEWHEAWSILEHTLLEFVAQTQRMGIPLVVLSVPAGQLVNADCWQNLVNASPAMQRQQWDLDGPERRLRAFTAEHNIPCLQPYTTFRAAAQNDSPLFFGNVGHLTTRGHEVMADALEHFLQAQQLFPQGHGTRR